MNIEHNLLETTLNIVFIVYLLFGVTQTYIYIYTHNWCNTLSNKDVNVL